METKKKKKRVFKDRTNLISLSERHIIGPNHPLFDECDRLCFLSKNLYNATLYAQRQSFFANEFQNYYAVNRIFTQENQPDYRALPAKVAKQTQMLSQSSFASYFSLVKKKNKGEYDGKVKLPQYLQKDGRQTINYEKGALSIKVAREVSKRTGEPIEVSLIKLSKTNILIKSRIPKDKITNVRIAHKGNHCVIEVLYDEIKPAVDVTDFSRVAFIDPGMNNLMTVTSNVFAPILYNGREAKSINQLYNKKRARAQERLPMIYAQKEPFSIGEQATWSKRLGHITHKRNMRIHDLFHKITTDLVNQLVANDVRTVIFGHNKGQKQDINLGRKTNQNFVSLPFTKLMSMLSYKCERVGIQFIDHEESHTSKCSFLDRESVEHHDQYLGRRVKRGLFKAHDGREINADINGSLNIGRKYMEEMGIYSDELHQELLAHRHNPQRRNIRVA